MASAFALTVTECEKIAHLKVSMFKIRRDSRGSKLVCLRYSFYVLKLHHCQFAVFIIVSIDYYIGPQLHKIVIYIWVVFDKYLSLNCLWQKMLIVLKMRCSHG